MRRAAAVLLLALPAALGACERMGGLAPFTTVSNPADSGAGSVTVAKGDSAYLISRRYNVPLRDLIEVNGLKPPYTLEVGQRLTLPASRQYVVQKGDSLYAISRMFNVEASELSRLNNLPPPYKVTVGQPLRLPGAGAATGGGGPPTTITSAPLPPTPPRAGRGGVETADLPPPGGASPPLEAPSVIPPASAPVPGGKPAAAESPAPVADGGYQPGQEPRSLRTPGSKPSAPSAVAPAAAEVPVKPAPPEKPPVHEVAAAAPPPPAAAPPTAEQEPPPRGGGRFLWPIKGKVLSTFGPKPDGMHNDGINIAAAKGASVVAADNGIVAYAGNELRGFGNLLLVKHADGWITAYAHLDTMAVERGAKVKRGQVIGTVGQTGAVTSPQLHFELRRGSQAIDPRDHMGGKLSAALFEPVSAAAFPGGRRDPG